MLVATFSDASFIISSSQCYGPTGIITGILIYSGDGEPNIFHAVDWSSAKKRRISYSSYGAEILSCADADDRGFCLKSGLNALSSTKLRHRLIVDSKGIYDTISTLHEGRKYRLHQTVRPIRNSIESH